METIDELRGQLFAAKALIEALIRMTPAAERSEVFAAVSAPCKRLPPAQAGAASVLLADVRRRHEGRQYIG